MKTISKITSQKGQSAVVVLLLLLFGLLAVIMGADYAYIFYLEKCGDKSLTECVSGDDSPEEDLDEGKEIVVATGSIAVKEYSASVSMNIPLEGGSITGSVMGDCSGRVEGTYDGKDGGVISGKIFGKCSPFGFAVPAKATFSGVVNKSTNNVPINATGSAAGFSGSRSLTLSY